MASDIVVRVGAAIDRSFDVVMGEIEKKAARASRALGKGGIGGLDKSAVQEARANARAMERISQDISRREMLTATEVYRQQSKLNQLAAREKLRGEQRVTIEQMRLGRQRTSERQKEIAKEEAMERAFQNRLLQMKIRAAKDSNRATRAAERAEARAGYQRDREIDRFATRTSHRATRFFFPRPEGALGYAKRVGMDLARGAGVDTSLSSGIGRARDREAAAVALSNQGWNPDAGDFDKRISAGELRAEAKKQALRLGLKGEDEVMSAMTKFTDVTGDLETAKQVIGDIGLLARSSGTSLEEAASAAADMAAQLPDALKGEGRQKAMQFLLNTAAMQGKRGAVEVKDLARYVPRIVAGATSFSGDPTKTMTELMATAQIARRYGGAGNGAQAATSVQAMVNTLKTPARVGQFRSQFKNAGLGDIYNEDGKLKSIPVLIKNSIIAASKDKDPQIAFKKMWGNVLGAKGPEGLFNLYKKGGGGKAGEAALDAEFKKFTGVLELDAQEKMLAATMSTTETKVNRFQIALDDVSEKMLNNLAPTMEKVGPMALVAVTKFAGALEWAVNNPIKTFGLAIVAAVGRAGIESGIRAIIDRAAANMMGGMVGGAAGGAAPGVGAMFAGKGAIGGAATGVGVAAVLAGTALAAYSLTTALLEASDASRQKSQQDRARTYNDITAEGTGGIAGSIDMLGVEQSYQRAKRAIVTADTVKTGFSDQRSPEAAAALKKLEEAYTERTTRNQKQAASLAASGLGSEGRMYGTQGITEAALTSSMAGALTGQTINVVIRNFEDMPNMSVAPGAAPNPGRAWTPGSPYQ